MSLHLVPGIFVPGRHLVVISDTVLVTPDGCEVLTDFPRELFEAPLRS
jgi:Xaa-Pro aminopeptidase